MSVRDWPRRLNRLQQTTPFKVVASIVLGALAAAAVVTYVVLVNRTGGGLGAPADGGPPLGPAAEALAKAYRDLASSRMDEAAVAVLVGALLVIGLVVVWLGVGLTYLALLVVTALVVAPMYALGEKTALTRDEHGAAGLTVRDLGRFLAGVVALSASFTALIQALRLLLAGDGPVFSIARNVVDEAVRLKISLVFIVMLIFGLAALPGLLDPTNPLRYRVQSFLQYSTSGTFWVIAVLVVFLSVATVAFEQRDRVIWQTMTKPVRAWQYVLGKWIGVSGVAAVLLAVSASGIFLFTGYLRFQPALEEVRAFVPRHGTEPVEDRNILESQVLTARVGIGPTLESPPAEELNRAVSDRFARQKALDDSLQDTPENRGRIVDELLKERGTQFYSLDPGATREYRFRGLLGAKGARQNMTLRFKMNAAGDDPRALFRMTFMGLGPGVFAEDDNQVFAPADPAQAKNLVSMLVRAVAPGQTHRLSLSPDAVQPDGTLTIAIANGDMPRNSAPAETVVFPPDGLELFYSAGGYRMNFLRVVVVLWLKLAFLAMIGIACGTFLSFPVASLVAFGVFLLAESSAFLMEALEYYNSADREGHAIVYKVAIRAIAVPVAYSFKFYSGLRPTANLVDGRYFPWAGSASVPIPPFSWYGILTFLWGLLRHVLSWFGAVGVLQAMILFGLLIVLVFGVGVLIFRRRELAIYSGH